MVNDIIEELGGANGLWYLGGVYFGLSLLERLYYAWHKPKNYNGKDALCSIGLNLISSVIGLSLSILIPLTLYILVYENYRIFTIDALLISIPLAFVLHELAYYWDHRLAHRVGILWAFHSVHHSSNEFNHTTAARNFYLDGQLKGIFCLVAAVLGVPPVVFFAIIVFKNTYGIWNHASYVGNLGIAEEIFATPRNHLIHHANQPQYIDKNYSQVLIVWDKMFGSFARYGEKPVPGLVTPVHNNNPLTAQFNGISSLLARMKKADRFSDKLAYLWRPPGWCHKSKADLQCNTLAPLAND